MKFKTKDVVLTTTGFNQSNILESHLQGQLEAFFSEIKNDGYTVKRYDIIQINGEKGIVWAEIEKESRSKISQITN